MASMLLFQYINDIVRCMM